MLELIGDADGKTVLDAGCGSGFYSITLAKQGAKVSGINISEKMILLAKKNARLLSANCRFSVGDIQDSSMFESETFDLVTSSIVVGYVNDLEKTFSEVHRVLKPNGIFTFSENHPILTSREEEWERDGEGEKLHFKIDLYFNRVIKIDDWKTSNGATILTRSRHRTVQDYFDSLVSTGFIVERLVEPEPIEEESARELKVKKMSNAESCLRLNTRHLVDDVLRVQLVQSRGAITLIAVDESTLKNCNPRRPNPPNQRNEPEKHPETTPTDNSSNTRAIQ